MARQSVALDEVKMEATALEALAALEQDGRLTPDDVVRAAEPVDHPLHVHFEWDDAKAGHAYRVVQARALIRGVKIIVTTETSTISTVRYVRDPAAGDAQGYVTLTQLAQEADNAAELIQAEFGRAAACLKRAEMIAEALGMGDKVAAVRTDVEALSQFVQRRAEGSA